MSLCADNVYVNATVCILLLCCVFTTVNGVAHVNLLINGDDDDDDEIARKGATAVPR